MLERHEARIQAMTRKDSGFGREGVRSAMESTTEARVLVIAPA